MIFCHLLFFLINIFKKKKNQECYQSIEPDVGPDLGLKHMFWVLKRTDSLRRCF